MSLEKIVPNSSEKSRCWFWQKKNIKRHVYVIILSRTNRSGKPWVTFSVGHPEEKTRRRVPLALCGLNRKDHSLLSKMVSNFLEKESVLILAQKNNNTFYRIMLSRKNSIKKTVKKVFAWFLVRSCCLGSRICLPRESRILQFVAMTSSISIF